MANSNVEIAPDTTQIAKTITRSSPAKPSEPVAHFVVVVEGTETGKKAELNLNTITIGRAQDSHLALSDPCVSSHHCVVRFQDGRILVEDNHSTNGTFLDDERIVAPIEWPLSSVLRIGGQLLRREFRRLSDVRREEAITDDLRSASRYMQSLLPLPLHHGPVRANWVFLPSAGLGGDIFDYYWSDTEHFTFYLLDVSGHGAGAALHSVSVFNLLRQRSFADTDFLQPAQVLTALNHSMPMDRYGDLFFTVWYGVYRLADRTLNFASAGHPPALLFDRAGHRLDDLDTSDPPIGVITDHLYRERQIELSEASVIYLYSDGIYEFPTPSGDTWSCGEFGDLVAQQLTLGQGQPELLFHAVRKLAQSDHLDDDVSLLAFRFLGE